MRVASEQHTFAVNYLPLDQLRFFGNHVRTRGRSILNVQDIIPAQSKIIRNQHAVTVKEHLLGTHDGSWSALGQLRDAMRRLLERRRKHVTAIDAQRLLAKSN